MQPLFSRLTALPVVVLIATALIVPVQAVDDMAPRWSCWPDDNSCIADLNSMALTTPIDGWAVGESGTILHWDGVEWAQVDSPTNASLWSVSALAADDGWAVGQGGTIVHWDGDTWEIVASSMSDQLESVTMITADDGWVVGRSGTILHWDGVEWSTSNITLGAGVAQIGVCDGETCDAGGGDEHTWSYKLIVESH